MPQFADFLSGQLDRPVINKTGLEGPYNFKLEWAPDLSQDSSQPSIFTALQEQLGLKLIAGNGPVEVLTIRHAAMPSAN